MTAVLGPTGVGKTEFASRLAGALGAEVVVADSRQVYRRLQIATNKPGPAQLERARFHMIDVVDPERGFDVHRYTTLATACVARIAAAGRPIVLEGGTGLYVDALLDGYSLGGVPARPERREELRGRPVRELAAIVRRLDREARVDPSNPVRLVRAIEVLEAAGPPLSMRRGRAAPAWHVVRVGLVATKEEIARRLAERVRSQIDRGLVEETRHALAGGVPAGAPALTGIGYAEAVRHLAGELSLDEMAAAMLSANRRYAKRQMTWLRRDRRIRWFPADPDPLPAVLAHLRNAAQPA
ncbi:MAG: tRNA (adenosine(37)-N6)-dimethylallyltransferase MiaA [Candidatus Dormibacterales bacterium]